MSESRFSRVGAYDRDIPDNGDEMCPNCVTPWKCNGPHLDDQTPRARREAARPKRPEPEPERVYEGRVSIVFSLIDPGDMGEPREFIEDGTTYIVVPDPCLWKADPDEFPILRKLAGGWGAIGEGWVAVGDTPDAALANYRNAERLHAEIRARARLMPACPVCHESGIHHHSDGSSWEPVDAPVDAIS